MMSLLIEALQQALIFLPVTLGIYLTYRIFRVTDLTVGGSYALGAAIFAKIISLGYSEFWATSLAVMAGLGSGFSVFALQKLARIDGLIASILMVFMLFSVNFAVMGQPNISLLNASTLLSSLQNLGNTALDLALLGFDAALMIGLLALLKTTFGLRLRAYGSNPLLLSKLGFFGPGYLSFGLMLSNGLAALCGVMNAEINGYADIHMDDGIALTAIGAVVIGTHLITSLFSRLKRISLGLELLGCLLGAEVYFFVLHLFLNFNINPIYLKLCLGLLLAAFLSTARYSLGRGAHRETLS